MDSVVQSRRVSKQYPGLDLDCNPQMSHSACEVYRGASDKNTPARGSVGRCFLDLDKSRAKPLMRKRHPSKDPKETCQSLRFDDS